MGENKVLEKSVSGRDKILSKTTRKNLKRKGRHPVRRGKKKHAINIDLPNSYNSLQYLGIVRHFIKKRYKIGLRDLEVLLFLYPLGLWSYKDYYEFPHPYSTRTMNRFYRLGFVEHLFDDIGKKSKYQVFRLTQQAKEIIVKLYKFLYQEVPLPEQYVLNPFFKKDITPFDQVKAKAMAVMNQKLREGEEITDVHRRLNNRIVKRVQATDIEIRKAGKEKARGIIKKNKNQERLEKIMERHGEERRLGKRD